MPRPAIPISEHKRRGTYRKGRHGNKYSAPAERLGEPPEFFNERMKAEWARLAALPHVKACHRAVVEHACVLYDRFVDDATGGRKMTASERATFHSVTMQLGGTPVTEAKIPAAPVEKADNPWAKFA